MQIYLPPYQIVCISNIAPRLEHNFQSLKTHPLQSNRQDLKRQL